MNNLDKFLDSIMKVITELAIGLYKIINQLFEGKMFYYLGQIALAFGRTAVAVLDAILGVLKNLIK